jgi:hypothetical protein
MKSAPVNLNDDELFCGGFDVQFGKNGGNCGLCGDNFNQGMPRDHEFGGTFGQGVVMKAYVSGSVIDVGVMLTANHMGYFIFDICDRKYGETEECFQKHRIMKSNGEGIWTVTEGYMFNITLKLPVDLVCDQCVLRWTYVTGHRGLCKNGNYGCGPQAIFRSCADIAIRKKLTYGDQFNWTDVCLKRESFVGKIANDHMDRKSKYEVKIPVIKL